MLINPLRVLKCFVECLTELAQKNFLISSVSKYGDCLLLVTSALDLHNLQYYYVAPKVQLRS